VTADESRGLLLVKEADRVWKEPSIDRITDALFAAIMSSPAPKPLAPEYNSSILHVLEAYRGLKKRLSDTEAQLAQETSSSQRQAESFEALASEWIAREAQYRAQIERMGGEVALGGSNGAPQATPVQRPFGPAAKTHYDESN
jgi:hypothetical protein